MGAQPETPGELKEIIFYHRAYRKLKEISRFYFTLEFIVLVLVFDALVLFLYPQVTHVTCRVSKYVLSFVMPPNTLTILSRPFLFDQPLYVITRLGRYPSTTFLLITLLITAAALIFVPRVKRIPKSVGIWVCFSCIIQLVSCFFFLYFGDRFPYDIEIFSDLYMRTQISMWLLIPFVLCIATAPLPANTLSKVLVIAALFVYSMLFGCVRYIVFFYVLVRFSYLFMPILFFAFGPLLDFLYIVGVYAFFVSIQSIKIKGDLLKWRWLY